MYTKNHDTYQGFRSRLRSRMEPSKNTGWRSKKGHFLAFKSQNFKKLNKNKCEKLWNFSIACTKFALFGRGLYGLGLY